MRVDIDEAEVDRRAELVVDEYGGVLHHTKVFYLRSIAYSASRAQEAFKRYDKYRNAGVEDSIQVSAVHEALGHAAALSRFFWPSKMGKKNMADLRIARAATLREAFSLGDDSPLRSRELRDALEHFDERLDKFLLIRDSGCFFPDAKIGDSDLADDPIGGIFKLVDPDKEVFVILGKKFDFGALRAEIERVAGTNLDD